MTKPSVTPVTLSLRTGLTLQGLQWGAEDAARTVLAIHGWLDNAASFWALGPELASRANCRVVALDLPGHGQSDWFPQAMPYHFHHWVEVIEDVLDALGKDPEEIDLLGHSMGASIVALYAGIRGARSVSMIEGLGPLTREGEAIVWQARKALLARATMQGREPREVTLAQAVEKISATRPGLSLTQAQHLATRQLTPRGHVLAFSYDPRLQAPSLLRMTEAQVLVMLQAITAPVLLIQAEDGMQAPAKVARERIACLGSLTHVMIPGGHHAHMDHAKACGDIIAKHL